MIGKYIKRPVPVFAVQWTGENLLEVCEFTGRRKWEITRGNGELKIKTLEGVMTAHIGDYIIMGVDGEIYPCKRDIFEKTYQELREHP